MNEVYYARLSPKTLNLAQPISKLLILKRHRPASSTPPSPLGPVHHLQVENGEILF